MRINKLTTNTYIQHIIGLLEKETKNSQKAKQNTLSNLPYKQTDINTYGLFSPYKKEIIRK